MLWRWFQFDTSRQVEYDVMRDPAKSIRRCILGILACEAVLLLAWINLGSDASAAGYSSVRSLLDWMATASHRSEATCSCLAAIRGSVVLSDTLRALFLCTRSCDWLSILVAINAECVDDAVSTHTRWQRRRRWAVERSAECSDGCSDGVFAGR
jgi:hypothetical protein